MTDVAEQEEVCDHTWVFGGLRYQESDYPRPGSSARDRIYWDWFYCYSCLASQHVNERVFGTSYDKPIEGAIPR
jgi:hypothetical protein